MSENKFDLSSYVIRDSKTGAVDVQASHLKFTQSVAALVQEERADSEVIAKAVEKAFRDRPGTKTLGMTALLHYAMESLAVPEGSFNRIRERVATYIRSNKNQFTVSKGKGGGVTWEHGEETARIHSAPPASSGSIRPRAQA